MWTLASKFMWKWWAGATRKMAMLCLLESTDNFGTSVLEYLFQAISAYFTTDSHLHMNLNSQFWRNSFWDEQQDFSVQGASRESAFRNYVPTRPARVKYAFKFMYTFLNTASMSQKAFDSWKNWLKTYSISCRTEIRPAGDEAASSPWRPTTFEHSCSVWSFSIKRIFRRQTWLYTGSSHQGLSYKFEKHDFIWYRCS